MVRILLADDHEIVREGLRQFLLAYVPGVAIDEASDGTETFEKIKVHNYDLIILDINMPGTDSFELLGNILNVKPGAKVLIYSVLPEEGYAKRYLQAGALGYITKDASCEELRKAITTVLQGNRYMSQALKELIAETLSGGETINPFETLSTREFEILRLLLKGVPQADIRSELSLKASTVSTYKMRIFKKLECKNVIELGKVAEVWGIS